MFDARAAPAGRPRLVTHRGLRVHFAPNPGDADALIEQLILDDNSPRQLVVVSSDHRLQRAAERRRAQPIDSDRWYADVVRRRVGRQQRAADEPAKPAGPLSGSEVAHWLGQFGMARPRTKARSKQSPAGPMRIQPMPIPTSPTPAQRAKSRRLAAIWQIPFRPATAKTCWKISKTSRWRTGWRFCARPPESNGDPALH